MRCRCDRLRFAEQGIVIQCTACGQRWVAVRNKVLNGSPEVDFGRRVDDDCQLRERPEVDR